MKRKLKIVLASVIGVITAGAACMGLGACGNDGHTHEFGSDWKTDGNKHWHECIGEDCSERDSEGNHDWQLDSSTPATCTEEGTKNYSCKVCGATKSETEPATGHNFADKWEKDKTEHWRVCQNEGCGYVESRTAHTYIDHVVTITPATCSSVGVERHFCVCGEYEDREVGRLSHDFTTGEWHTTDTEHWHVCNRDGCDVEETHAPHEYTIKSTVKLPTCAEKGEDKYSCVCGKFETREVDVLGHDFDETEWKYTSETHWHACTHTGCTEKSGEAPHVWTTKQIVKPATCISEGEELQECICGATKTVTIPKTDHNFDTSVWAKNERHHWHACTTEGCLERQDQGKHDLLGADEACSVCGKAHEHHFAPETWLFDNYTHWHAATCGHDDLKGSVGTHDTNGADGACSVCGYKTVAPHEHNYNTAEWAKTIDGHWHACTFEGCTERTDFAAHDTAGLDGDCSVCGFEAHTFGTLYYNDFETAGNVPFVPVGGTPSANLYGSTDNAALTDYTADVNVKIENGKLHVIDNNTGATTYAFIMLDNAVSYQRIRIRAKVELSTTATKWAFMTLVDREGNEIASIRTGEKTKDKIGIRVYGADGSIYVSDESVCASYAANKEIEIGIDLKLVNGEIVFSVAGVESDVHAIKATDFAGIKIITSKGQTRSVYINELQILGKEVIGERLKDRLTNRLATIYEVRGADTTLNSTDLDEAYEAGVAAIAAAATDEAVKAAYENTINAIGAIPNDTAQGLLDAKSEAVETLQTYVDEADYTINIDILKDAIKRGTEAINAAKNEEAVQTALENAQLEIDEIKTDAIILEEAQASAKAELETYPEEDYTVNADELAQAVSDGQSAIDLAETLVEVATELQKAKEAIAAIKTDSQEFETVKANAVKEIKEYSNVRIDELGEEHASVKQAIADEKAAVESAINAINLTRGQYAESVAAVNGKLTDGKNEIERLLKSTTQSIEEIRGSAQTQLREYGELKIRDYDASADAQLIADINKAVSDGVDAIGTQADTDGVNAKLAEAKAAIDKLISDDAVVKAKLQKIEELNAYKVQLQKEYYLEAAKQVFETEYTAQVANINNATDLDAAFAAAKAALDSKKTDATALELADRDTYGVKTGGTKTLDMSVADSIKGGSKVFQGWLTAVSDGTKSVAIKSNILSIYPGDYVMFTTSSAGATLTVAYSSTQSGRSLQISGPNGFTATINVEKGADKVITLGEAGEYHATAAGGENKATKFIVTEPETVTQKTVNSVTATVAASAAAGTDVNSLISGVTLNFADEGSAVITEGYKVVITLNGEVVSDMTAAGEYEVTVVYGEKVANRYNSYTAKVTVA